MSTLLLIDGHSQAYRAYFGVKTPLATSNGELTTAVFGFARKLLSIVREYEPDGVVVAFDKGETWRHDEFAEYKATRDAMPDDMASQMGRIRQMLEALHIPIVTFEGYEADDVLGTLATKATNQQTRVLILTGDRDMFQLINERVQVLYTSGGPRPQTKLYGEAEVRERFDLEPTQIIDLKALTGDSSDNIPGIPGVGDKTAAKFLNEYGTLENLYDHVDEISGPKTRQSVIDAKEQVERNKRLVTIVTDLDIPYDPDAFRLGDYDREAVTQLFTELEFRSLLDEVPQVFDPHRVATVDASGQMPLFEIVSEGKASAPPAHEEVTVNLPEGYRIVKDADDLAWLVERLGEAERICFDVETTSTNPHEAALVGYGIAWAAGQAAYVPVAHERGEQLPWDEVVAAIQPVFADAALPKIAHNAKYDLIVSRRHGLEIVGDIHDTMTMAWLLNPASRSLGLKAQAAQELGWQMTEITDLIGKGRAQITMDAVSALAAGAYCCADVDATIQIYDKLVPKLHGEDLWKVYEQFELPLLPVLADIEQRGVLLDLPYLQEMSVTMVQRLGEIQHELFHLTGGEFNLRSTQQMAEMLFERMDFPTKGIKRNASGKYSTAVGELEKLREADLSDEQARVLDLIFEQRQLEKLRGTYIDALPTLADANGRVHTSYNQTGTVTGRLSSNSPNLQNIPNRTEMGREIRRGFIAPAGWQLIAADYSQVELRILAHVTGEPKLVEAFSKDQDIHATTASLLFDVPLDKVTKDQRGLGKTINFATIYGISAFGLSNRTELSPKQAGEFLRRYFENYPLIQKYIDDTIEQAREKGYVDTLFGRKRFFPELQRRLPGNQRQSIERAAINAPIQGTNADIMKIAMVQLHQRLRDEELDGRMLLQVHDELVLEAPVEQIEATKRVVCETMESAYKMKVPLKVEVGVGSNWFDA